LIIPIFRRMKVGQGGVLHSNVLLSKSTMVITSLPEETIRLLGSAQSLTTPTSLVKELVDNALDARASSIDIHISPNTIDKIEVRDNGHGIPQEDLDALGKHGHTSKLRSFDELRSIGGVSLGFRGEALASAVQLGEVSVTTKTDGEAVATTVKLKAPGGVASQSRTSHPIGTTVSVANFLFKLPVRKQTALKEATKTLGKIKALLQAYALARPSIRFNLKITKGGKGSWSFAPRPNDGIREAVSQVIGRDAAMQCIEKLLVFADMDARGDHLFEEAFDNIRAAEGTTLTRKDQFSVELLLPKPDADPSLIGHGQFISIDSRPVSHDKGTMRKIVTLFKYYVKESISESPEKLKNPFLRMDVRCPIASYDPNVEPAKDDVIFGNECLLLDSIEQLLKDVYGERKVPPVITPLDALGKKLDDFELLLARNVPAPLAANSTSSPARELISTKVNQSQGFEDLLSPSPSNEVLDNAESGAVDEKEIEIEPVSTEKRKWVDDMSTHYSEDVEGYRRPHRPSKYSTPTPGLTPKSDIRPTRENALNPWLIAKMNTPVRSSNGKHSLVPVDSSKVEQQTPNFLPTPHHSSDPILSNSEILESSIIQPRPRQTFRNSDATSLFIPLASHHDHQMPNEVDIEPGMSGRALTVEQDDELLLVGDDSEIFRRRNDFVSARNVPDPPSFPISQPIRTSRKPRGINKPFVSPIARAQNYVPQDGLRQTKLTTDYPPPGSQNGKFRNGVHDKPNPELAWAMDFEHRKEDATRKRRQELRTAHLESEFGSGESTRPSPHKNRYNAAAATLTAGPSSVLDSSFRKEPLQTSLVDGDPRAYLMRRQKSMLAQGVKPGEQLKLTRAKSMRLPLERIPDQEKLHMLMYRATTGTSAVVNIAKDLLKVDLYVSHGKQAAGLSKNSLDITTVTNRIQSAVDSWMSVQPENRYEVDYMFENLLSVK
jgi:DNA mismatch repair protein MutL